MSHQDGGVAALQDTLRARSEALARVVRERDEARADLEAALEQVDVLRGEWEIAEGRLSEVRSVLAGPFIARGPSIDSRIRSVRIVLGLDQ